MINNCPICFNKKAKLYSTQKLVDQDIDYQILVCVSCYSAYTNPLPTDKRLQNLYATSFDYRWYQDHYDAKLKDCRIRVKEYAPTLGKRILDFGGGMGYFSRAVKETGLECVTYDPFLSAEPPTKNNWDTVVALHVLEHSNDLDRTMSEIKEFLVPGGRVVFAVPNFTGLGYKERGMNWVWAQPPLIHIFHFTAAGLTALLTRHGFKDVQVSYHDRWDANYHADVLNFRRQRWLDSLWGIQPFNRFGLYRRLVAFFVTKLRLRSLQRSAPPNTPEADRAELVIVARK